MANYMSNELSGFIPVEQSDEVVKLMVRGSSVLRLAKVETMSSDTKTVPVMTEGAGAYWVGEGQRIQTSKATWIFPKLEAKKLAVIIPCSREKLNDPNIDIFEELRENIAEAFYTAIDSAALFGTNSPFKQNIFQTASERENLIAMGTNKTLDLDVSDAMAFVEASGTDVNGVIAPIRIRKALRELRDTNGNMLYVPGTDTTQFYQNPIEFNRNGAWDESKAELIVGDWTKLLVGIRQDIEYQILTEAALQGTLDEDGKPLSLAEQDLAAIKATMRIGFLQVMDDAFSVITPAYTTI